MLNNVPDVSTANGLSCGELSTPARDTLDRAPEVGSDGLMSDELFEHKTKTQLTREEAAKRIHELADAIARHNEVSYVENNKTVRVDIPDSVQLKIEIERGTEESELEIEISW